MIKLFKIVVALVFVSFATVSGAQVIAFEKTTHDFGTAPESVGALTYEFKFTNTGDKPLVINRVNASCGCTTTGWTKEPVQPGASGTVTASYATKGRVSPFTKTLTVVSNSTTDNTITLYIKGTVTAAPVDIRKDYPDSIGALRVKNLRDLSFARIDATKTSVYQTLEVANPTAEKLNVVVEGVPEYLNVSVEPGTLDSKQRGVIRVSVNGPKRKSYGYAQDAVTVKVGNVKKSLKISSVVAETFPALSGPDADNGPKATYDNTITFAGKEATATIQNDGQADLIIKSFTTTNNTITGSSKTVKIKPGKSTTVKFAAKQSQDLNGSKIYLGTNDPRNPLLELTVKAN